jgi:hypothetical protein
MRMAETIGRTNDDKNDKNLAPRFLLTVLWMMIVPVKKTGYSVTFFGDFGYGVTVGYGVSIYAETGYSRFNLPRQPI